MSTAVPFDTLAFVRKLEASGIPTAQAEAQAEALSDAFQKVEEYRMRELATKGDLETAKVDIIKWVVTTGIVILGGVAAINRLAPPVPAYYQPPAQEMRLPVPAAPTTPTR
ncbi:MAG: CCDC90 family protein [Magnetococcus sp. DMHC-8]